MSRFLHYTLSSCLVILFLAAGLSAQTATATLNGVVQDEQGSVVPNAKVTVSDPARGLKRNVMTNDDGQFTVTFLPPSTYTVTVEQTGFNILQVNEVTLNVADSRTLALQLQIKTAQETVEVDGAAVDVKRTPEVSTTIDKTFVQKMPLNARSFSTLVLLTPGVTLTAVGIDGGTFSVNGQRASTNSYSIDGVGANIGATTLTPNAAGTNGSMMLAGTLPAATANGSAANLVSLDALEDFKVQTSTYNAASGRQPGGQLQLITRSGTNDYHGSAFEYFRNEALDARNYFNKKPAAQTPLRQNIFGGTLGGPILFPNFGDGGPGWYSGKNKTFFFFSYEGQRLRVPRSFAALVPSIRFRDRVRNSLTPALLPLLNYYPIPTDLEALATTSCPAPPATDPRCDPVSGRLFSGLANFRTGLSEEQKLDATSIRLDQRFGSRLSMFGRYNHAPSASESYSFFVFNDSGVATDTLTLGATYSISSKLTNDFRFNRSWNAASLTYRPTTIGGAVPITPSLVTNGNGGFGQISFLNTFAFVEGKQAESRQNQINVVDNLTFVSGDHQLQFGVDYRRLGPTFSVFTSRGLSVDTEAAAVAATVSSYGITNLQPARPQFDNLSLYVQDSWKTTKRLTLDLGLRWEFNPPPTEASGQMPTVITGIIGADVSQATRAPAGTPFYKTFYHAFAPRFGTAYLLRGSLGHETVIRGGVGVYYDLGNGTASMGWPFQAIKTLNNRPFPISDRDAASPTTFAVREIALNNDLKLPFSLQWNVAVEQSLGKFQTVSVSYVASAGRRLLSMQSVNRMWVDPVTGTLVRPNPSFGDITVTNSNATSDYHSMQVQYKARISNTLQALVNYTWGHAIDEVSADNQSLILDRGNANFDVRHNFSAAIHYSLPSPHFGGPIGYILRDWSADLLIHAQSGLPFDVIIPGSTVDGGNTVSRRPDLVARVPIIIDDPSQPGGRRLNTAAFTPVPTQCVPVGQPICTTITPRQGTFGRNVLRNLPIYQADVALARTFLLGEKLNLQLKGEVFNVFNHPMFRLGTLGSTNPTLLNFGIPNQTLNDGLRGMNPLHQLGGPRSIQLSARFAF